MTGVTASPRGWRALALFVLIIAVALRVPLAPAPPARAEPALTGAPVRLVLPSIAVDAEVDALALNDDLTMPVPQRAALVAWYTYSSPAGGTGNAVLAGHRDWQRQKGVFYDLGKVHEGDEVWLQDAGANWYLYTVAWTVSLEDDDAPVEDIAGYTESPSVTLITCSGTFDRSVGRYVERRVVRAQLVAVIPAPD